MGSFRLGGMTFSSLFKKPDTLLYPLQTKAPYEGQKGHVVNDTEKCILCSKCQKVCPCNAILVNKAERRWEINPFRCVQCGNCIRNCPVSCLSMDPSATPVAAAKYCKDLEVPEHEG